MTNKLELFQQRLKRYSTAMRNGKPDMVPIRPFAAEVTATYAGMTCQQVTHDYRCAFEAILKCAMDFDWDATVPNMVYVWTGLSHLLGTKYYAIPGLDVPGSTGFQYREPPDNEAFLRDNEYDRMIEDPVGFLVNVWLPRTNRRLQAPGEPTTYESLLTGIGGAMAMKRYFADYGPHIARMTNEAGMPCAICGILKAPFDIIADKFRGYRSLVMDIFSKPDKVLKLIEALTPHLLYMAKRTSDPSKTLPVGLWLHRGCVPFLSPPQFEKFFWPSLKHIICELWKEGIQTLFYAEGEWNPNLKHIAELPDQSIVYHVDRGDIFEVHRAVGHKFCISGGIPNDLLAFGTPAEVRECVKKVIQGVGRDGGYILDASAIMQNDTKIENLKAMTDAGREFGQY